ncbi:MAG: Uma2 family endonuclease [Saprospiraceae bacterium]|nr:Uma2 family endonuclease [Saprospiraceae bacterium]
MNAFQLLPNYTYDDYLLWEGRWEIINGIAYAMSPAPNPRHQRLAGKIHSIFLNAIENIKKCKCQVYQPIDFKITEHTVVNPDLLIVCKPILKQFLDFPPALVVEILSPSTELKDRNTKYHLYESFGIAHYIIIDPETEKTEIYSLNSMGKYQLNTDINLPLTLEGDCNILPDWEQIFVE